MRRPASAWDRRVIEAVLSYQFNGEYARVVAGLDGLEVEYSSTGRLRYVVWRGSRILTRRAGDGLFSLSRVAGELLRRTVAPPAFRVVVREPEVVSGSVLAVIVERADEAIRPGDEVIVVDEQDELVGVGRARVSGALMASLPRGEVVRVRKLASRGGVA